MEQRGPRIYLIWELCNFFNPERRYFCGIIMILNKSLRFKAAFLLVVFGLNTVLGFACSIGIDMGYNSSHHGAHAGKAMGDTHKGHSKHTQSDAHAKHKHANTSTDSKKDDCCKGNVVKLQKTDKSFQQVKASVALPFYVVPKNESQLRLFAVADPRLQADIACHFHPPPESLRISIGRFQI